VNAAALLSAIQSRGSDATDLRDAAHEACHALQWKVTKRWTRDNIHAKKPKRPGFGVGDEIVARAVEQLVCRELGVDCGPVSKWAHVCWMETLKNERISLPTGDWLETRINEAMTGREANKLAAAVLALTEKKASAAE
jgi:hypothetical protein